jgi:hypothetical protein
MVKCFDCVTTIFQIFTGKLTRSQVKSDLSEEETHHMLSNYTAQQS